MCRRTSRSFANGSSASYSYDPVSELTQLTLNGGGYFPDTITLGNYSPAGEIGTRTHSNDYFGYNQSVNANAGFSTNGLNQYTAIGGVAQSYDRRGNLTASGNTTYAYNSRNELVGGSNIGGYGFYYDPLGRLDTDGPESVWFGYDDDRLVSEINYSDHSIARRYVFGSGTDEPLVWYEGSGTSDRRFMDADERGSIVRVTDNANATKYIDSYDEFGMPQANPVGRFLYTGQAWLPSAGMYYYKARMYSPSLGRFMQTDPSGYADGMNWYNYVGSNPVNGTDPSGMDGDISRNCLNQNPGDACFGSPPSQNNPPIEVIGDRRPTGIAAPPITPSFPIGSPPSLGVGSKTSPQNDEIVVNGKKDKPKPFDWGKLGSCLGSSALNHYGLGGATAASGALAIPIPKAIVPPYRVIGSKTTNLLSVLGHFAEVNVSRIEIGGLGSTNLLRIAGRANPYVAAGLLAVDAAVIGYDTYQCYNSGG